MYFFYYLLCILTLVYSATIFSCIFFKYKTSQQDYIRVCHECSEVKNNAHIYQKWYRAPEYKRYCIGWIFHQYPETKIEFLEITRDEQFLLYKLMITSQSKLCLDKLKMPPFGKIQCSNALYLDEVYKYEIIWSMLDIVNDNIVDCPAKINLSLQAIIKSNQKSSTSRVYKLLINDQWQLIDEYINKVQLAGYPFSIIVNTIRQDKISLITTRSDGSLLHATIIVDGQHCLDLVADF